MSFSRVACYVVVAIFTFTHCLQSGVADDKKLPTIYDVEVQPLLAHANRLQQALNFLGQPLDKEATELLKKAAATEEKSEARRFVQEALDRYCLFGVQINAESRVKVVAGPAKPILDENGWRQFLVKVHNEAGVTAKLAASSPNAGRLAGATKDKLRDLWLEMRMFDERPLSPALSGLKLEYRVIQLYSRDAGKRAAEISFNVGQGTQDIGFRNDCLVTFDCQKSNSVQLRVLDENGQPSTAGFVFRDGLGRVYPSQAKRLAPDFAFHPQIYRHDLESINLPEGEYEVAVSRGPEYLAYSTSLKVGDGPTTLSVQLKRWVDPAKFGWWSGDHHIHAAGCAHYTNPTEGVHAADMFRHCLGEDLKVGANLTWGPCFDYQKQFFTGKVDSVSKYPYLLRYDVEVSGFGSHRSGHLCLLRLKKQIPPGGDSKNHWPTLCLNTLKWGKKQGGVCGPAHSGWGISVPGTELPNYNIPPFDGIGACEYVADVTHLVEDDKGEMVPAVDFMSLADTPSIWELNMWYHTLNCGFETRVSGETDFPCIYGERVGLGRSYVKLKGKLDYDSWCLGIREGNAYVSDGRSHLMDFTINEATLGEACRVKLKGAGQVSVSARVAAMLSETPSPDLRNVPYTQKPYWHIERARMDGRQVKVELIVNGESVQQKAIVADGKTQDVEFDVNIDRSSWVAMRILPSSHTNPIFVSVGDKPIRVSSRSAQWCLDSVAKCREQKRKFIAQNELEDFANTYDHATKVYSQILAESGQ
ncbi:MAG: hypothetical protein ACI9G1_000587 [Pirellulaceae bacterium]|jgi:hypothetical protein